jgi:hypothetical protein
MHNTQNMEKILHQCKISMHSPQNVDKILHQHKISTYSPENMDEILLQCKTSTQRPQNVEKMPHLHKKRQPHRAAFCLSVGKKLVVHCLKILN